MKTENPNHKKLEEKITLTQTFLAIFIFIVFVLSIAVYHTSRVIEKEGFSLTGNYVLRQHAFVLIKKQTSKEIIGRISF